MSCEISVVDTHNLARHLPILGQKEKLKVVFALSGADDVSYDFEIYATRNKLVTTAGRTQLLVLSGTSPETFKDSHTKISKSFYGTIDETIKEIYDDYLKVGDKELTVDVKTTDTKKKIIIPNWSPLTAINWLTARAVAVDNSDACNFVFYEDRDGFHFTTLDKLVDVSLPEMGYMWNPRKYRDMSNASAVRGQRDVGYEHRNLEELRFADPGNRLEEINSGMYSSKILTHDIVRKHYEFVEYSLKDEWDKINHVEENYPLIKVSDELSAEYSTVYDFKPKHLWVNR